MNKILKKALAFLLCAVMIFGSVGIGGEGLDNLLDAFGFIASAETGTARIVECGMYANSKLLSDDINYQQLYDTMTAQYNAILNSDDYSNDVKNIVKAAQAEMENTETYEELNELYKNTNTKILLQTDRESFISSIEEVINCEDYSDKVKEISNFYLDKAKAAENIEELNDIRGEAGIALLLQYTKDEKCKIVLSFADENSSDKVIAIVNKAVDDIQNAENLTELDSIVSKVSRDVEDQKIKETGDIVQAKACAKQRLESEKTRAKSDEAKSYADEVICLIDNEDNINNIYTHMQDGIDRMAQLDTALAEAINSAKTQLNTALSNAVSDEAEDVLIEAMFKVQNAESQSSVSTLKVNAVLAAESADKTLAETKTAAKKKLEEARNKAKSDTEKAVFTDAISGLDKARSLEAVETIVEKAEMTAANAAKALADAKAEAKTALEDEKKNAVSDEAKAALEEAIKDLDNAISLNAVADKKAAAKQAAKAADKELACAKAEAKKSLETAKEQFISDDAKTAIDEAITAIERATNLDSVKSAKISGVTNAVNMDEAYLTKIKFDKVLINISALKENVDYRSIITVKATAKNIPEGYILAMYIDGKTVKGTNTEVSYEYGELKSNIDYTVKVIDTNGNVQKDSNGNELSKDSKITVNAGFFKKLVAFFKGLFKLLPEVEVKP